MSSNNQFYNSPLFTLIKVKFSEVDSKRYTYAAHIKHDVRVGDWVTVPVGAHEDVFSVKGGYRDVQTVQVTGVTKNMNNLPTDYDVKHIVSNLKRGNFYRKILQAKNK